MELLLQHTKKLKKLKLTWIQIFQLAKNQQINCSNANIITQKCQNSAKKNKVELAYCITESYCPREARKFFECVTRAPGLYPTSNYYPPRCQRLWNSLDKCMISFQVPDDGVTENPDERYAPDDDNDKNSFNYENFFDDD